jgi:hypothetical protein
VASDPLSPFDGPFFTSLAACVAEYTDKLVNQGFKRDEAIRIAAAWQQSYLQVIYGPSRKTDGEAD